MVHLPNAETGKCRIHHDRSNRTWKPILKLWSGRRGEGGREALRQCSSGNAVPQLSAVLDNQRGWYLLYRLQNTLNQMRPSAHYKRSKILESTIKEKFLDELRRRADSMRCGNRMDKDISAITASAQTVKIRDMVDNAVSKGAHAYFRKQIDGSVPPKGLFYPPAILTGVTEEMRTARHEIFGPVLACMDFEDEEEAIAMANDSDCGLAGGVWTGDEKKAMRVATRIRAGTVWINVCRMLSAAAPRGGFKESGIGRELGIEGLMEFTQTRHLFIGDSSGSLDDIAYGLVLPDR